MLESVDKDARLSELESKTIHLEAELKAAHDQIVEGNRVRNEGDDLNCAIAGQIQTYFEILDGHVETRVVDFNTRAESVSERLRQYVQDRETRDGDESVLIGRIDEAERNKMRMKRRLRVLRHR
jgi:hypothetical protein